MITPIDPNDERLNRLENILSSLQPAIEKLSPAIEKLTKPKSKVYRFLSPFLAILPKRTLFALSGILMYFNGLVNPTVREVIDYTDDIVTVKEYWQENQYIFDGQWREYPNMNVVNSEFLDDVEKWLGTNKSKPKQGLLW